MDKYINIAYFISPHGFGHASRSAAVMDALIKINPLVHFSIFTTVPSWFFQDSLPGHFTYNSLMTDIGLVQPSPLQEDLKETIRALDKFLPFQPSQIRTLSRKIKKLDCKMIVCDIAPMGIQVAKASGIPCVLIENFTWDWIYQGYIGPGPGLKKHIDYLRDIFNAADFHIQTAPACTDGNADLTTMPVSRKIKRSKALIREQLKLPVHSKAILITMGGISEKFFFLEELLSQRDIHFIIPGGSDDIKVTDNLVRLPFHSDFFHPDLVNAADAVIGKLGYSTLAEVFHAGVPFGYISRPGFPESEPLVQFVQKEMTGLAIKASEFQKGDWIQEVKVLLAQSGIHRAGPNGADQIAAFLVRILSLRP